MNMTTASTSNCSRYSLSTITPPLSTLPSSKGGKYNAVPCVVLSKLYRRAQVLEIFVLFTTLMPKDSEAAGF